MIDRDLLELAAKACGFEYTEALHALNETCERNSIRHSWNPLNDDGDALRLAVKCRIDFYTGDDDGEATYAGYFDPSINNRQRFAVERHKNHGGDAYTATRRAIVRAAAELTGPASQGPG